MHHAVPPIEPAVTLAPLGTSSDTIVPFPFAWLQYASCPLARLYGAHRLAVGGGLGLGGGIGLGGGGLGGGLGGSGLGGGALIDCTETARAHAAL
jgi:hypothetical protein